VVQALVDTDEDKSEMLRALLPVAKNPAVRIDVSTAAEALQRQQRNESNQTIVRQFSGSDDRVPAYEELHRYFSRQARRQDRDQQASTDDSTDQAVRTFAAQVVGRSRRVLSHALELKQLKERFTPRALSSLTPEARKKWFGMIRRHAEAVRSETGTLIEQLQPIFFASNNPEKQTSGLDISNAEELATSVERLYQLVIANDEIVRSVFSVSSERPDAAGLKDARFRVALGQVEALAGRIQVASVRLCAEKSC
jgi:hypothetical protein